MNVVLEKCDVYSNVLMYIELFEEAMKILSRKIGSHEIGR